MNADGYVSISSRTDDMIIRRGREHLSARDRGVPPHAPEDHAGIRDRRARPALRGAGCAWIAVRDGETVTADEVRSFCHGQISTYKIPRYVRLTCDFPVTVTGKIQKFRMREISVEELGLSAITRT